jgi:DNA repair exonuclease SbcCD ATPase subunit
MNRFAWDLREKGAIQVPGLFSLGGEDGPLVPPGSYQVRLIAGDHSVTRTLELREDPRIETGGEGYREQQALLAEIRTAIDELNDSVLRARAVKEQVDEEVKRAADLEGNDEGAEAIEEAGKELAKALTAWEETVVQPKSETFQDIINFPNRLDAQVLFLFGAVDESGPPVTEGAKARWATLEAEWRERQAGLQKILDEQVAAFNAMVAEHRVPAVVIPPAGKHLEENGEDRKRDSAVRPLDWQVKVSLGKVLNDLWR